MRKLSLIILCFLLCSSVPIFSAFAASGSDIEDMTPALDSIMRAMMNEGAQYDPNSPEFFWEAIYLLAVNWSLEDSVAEIDDVTYDLLLPSMAVREMAVALFAEYDGFLPIPDSVSWRVKYDDDLDVYRFRLSDAGDSRVKIDRYELSLTNFVFDVYTSLVSCNEEETLLSIKFGLMPDTNSGDIIIRYYPYNIVSAEIVE